MCGRRSHSLGDFFSGQKPFVSHKKDPKQTLCSLSTSYSLYTCGFVIEGDRKCGEHFATRAGQAKHKKETGHVKRKIAQSVEQADD